MNSEDLLFNREHEVMEYIDTGAENWQTMSAAKKKKQLYIKQKQLLDEFLERGAISETQYRKSLGDLTSKMGMQEVLSNLNAK